MNTSIPEPLKVNSHNEYKSPPFGPDSVHPNPIVQFREWFDDARSSEGKETAKVLEPEAMSLATANSRGVPSMRTVLLKGVDSKGFVFFTNYTSRKSQEILQNPHAALGFYWREIHRQVRVVGRVEKLEEEESNLYFNSRPLGSRIGAWASPQSQVVEEADLASSVEAIKRRFEITGQESDANIPRPEFWGGWRVVPEEVEFWCGKPSRLHDRVRYKRREASASDAPEWTIERLAP